MSEHDASGVDLTGASERGLGMPSDEDMRLLRADMAVAHAEGLHDDVPREFCPECEGLTA